MSESSRRDAKISLGPKTKFVTPSEPSWLFIVGLGLLSLAGTIAVFMGCVWLGATVLRWMKVIP